jgi:hypothetical protein
MREALMTFAALVLAQGFSLMVSPLLQQMSAMSASSRYRMAEFAESLERADTSRYHLAELAESLERADTFRYRMAEFAESLERADTSRYHLAELAESLERVAPSRYHLSDLEQSLAIDRCICMTTRFSPLTLESEVLLVGDCECGK